jgi:N-acyl amino acid synthase of PEP-CTERM/exosortase system
MGQIKSLLKACTSALKQYSFTNTYHNTFELVRADSPILKEKAYRLRHKVYCEEHGYECPTDKGSFMESDEFDDRSLHFLLMHKVSHETVGTLRVILPHDEQPGRSFPAQQLCDHPLLQFDSRALSLCEISRFCMAPRFRKRDEDGKFLSAYHDQDTLEVQENGKPVTVRRRIPYPQAALLTGAFEAALNARILDCVWMVEPGHLRSLDKIGFAYRVLGPKVKRHGGVQPLVFNIKHVLDNMRTKAPHCWDIVSDSGRLQEMADMLHQNDWHDRLIDEDCWEEIYKRLSI